MKKHQHPWKPCTITILHRPCQWSCQVLHTFNCWHNRATVARPDGTYLAAGCKHCKSRSIGLVIRKCCCRSLLFLNKTLQPTESPFAYFLGLISERDFFHNQLTFFHGPASFFESSHATGNKSCPSFSATTLGLINVSTHWRTNSLALWYRTWTSGWLLWNMSRNGVTQLAR